MRSPNTPITQIKGMYFKNPFAILAHPTRLTNPNGRVTPELLMYYKSLVQTEAALVITGPATIIPPTNRKHSLLRVDQPKYLDGLRTLCKIIETNGGIPGVRITHPGTRDANEFLTEIPAHFKEEDREIDENKLISTFCNACHRAVEVGFRYVELGACSFLPLHRLIEGDREESVRVIFNNAVKAAGDICILGLRLHPRCSFLEKYARLFLMLGGNIISYEPNVAPGELPAIRRPNMMVNIDRYTSQRNIRELLKRCSIIGLPHPFKEKRRQVYAFFSKY